MGHHAMNERIPGQRHHALLLPRHGRCRVLVEEMSAGSELLTIEGHHKVEVPSLLIDCVVDCFTVLGFRIIHSDIPLTECGARQRSNQPYRLLLVHHLASDSSNTYVANVLHCTIFFARLEVQGGETSDIQAPP